MNQVYLQKVLELEASFNTVSVISHSWKLPRYSLPGKENNGYTDSS